LAIQLKGKDSAITNVTALFRPRRQELLIDSIEKVKTSQESLLLGNELIQKILSQNIMIPTFEL